MSSSAFNTSQLGENKVLILYFLKKIDGNIIEDTLFKLVTSVNNINYFLFKDILIDLVDSKLVLSFEKENNLVFYLTEKGLSSFELTKGLLPGIVKLQADTVFSRDYATLENNVSVTAEFTPKSENEYIVKCKIVENSETIFEIKTFAGSRKMAQLILDNWNDNASTIYPQVIKLLTIKN